MSAECQTRAARSLRDVGSASAIFQMWKLRLRGRRSAFPGSTDAPESRMMSARRLSGGHRGKTAWTLKPHPGFSPTIVLCSGDLPPLLCAGGAPPWAGVEAFFEALRGGGL